MIHLQKSPDTLREMACAGVSLLINPCLSVKSQHKGLLISAHYNPKSSGGRSRCSAVGYLSVKASSEGMTTIEKLGIKIERNPPESKLTELGVRSWPK